MSEAVERIPCQRVVRLLLDYLEGDLSETAALSVSGHLDDCPQCDEFVAQYRRTSEVCRDELVRSMPAVLESRLIDYLRAQLETA